MTALEEDPAAPAPPTPTARRVRRWPLVAVLAGALVAGLVLGPPSPSPPAGPTPPADPVVLPPEGTRSSAWYCGAGRLVPRADAPGDEAGDEDDDGNDDEGDSTGGGEAVADPGRFEAVEERISITNLGERDTSVRITVMATDEEPSGRQVPVPAGEVVTVEPEAFSPVPQPGVVVEPFSDAVVVEQLVGDESGSFAVAPCATEPVGTWWFPAGTTVVGTEQWLSVFNPFGDDAIVDVEFVATDGRRTPEQLSGLVVPRTSRRVVAVHEVVRRDELAAVSVTARVGRVAAFQTIVFTGDGDDRRGLALSNGAVAPAPRWYFADGRAADGAVRRVVVVNPGDNDVDVDVLLLAEDGSDLVFDPVTVAVARRSASVVEVASTGAAVPEDDDPDDGDGPDDGDAPDGDGPDDGADDPESGEFVEAVTGVARLSVPAGVAYALALEVVGSGAVVAEDLAWTTGDASAAAISGAGTSRPARRWVFGRRTVPGATEVRFTVMNPTDRVASVSVRPLGGADGDDGEPVTLDVSARTSASWTLDDPDGPDGGVDVRADRPVVVERAVVGTADASRGPGIPAR